MMSEQTNKNPENGARLSQLQALEQEVSRCHKCELKDGRTKVVFGCGNPDAEVMIIGEAPGKNEDLQGEPFVGRAGQYLDQLLGLAGLSREEVYIANVVKCRPPGNRNPKADEILACAPYLRAQTALVKPRIIVTLGNFATRFILKTEVGITKLHGKPVKKGKFIVYPVYHPAATMYDISKREAIEQDFAAIKKM